ncbi:MAG TPA: BadF/BadG/BcrA/BcrD ATPase family protein [Candidatus Angelobacter sp.]|nr:BadF/BadG/BcrA/BcrD ATPase family protein [Candidatus Angelobacter sp.]
MPFYLGIDAGGTKTDCVIGSLTSGNEVGRDAIDLAGEARGKSSKVSQVGETEARRTLEALILEACASSKIAPKEIRAACIGIAGASLPGVVVWAKEVIGKILFGCEAAPAWILVKGDHEIAQRAAFGKGPGVIVAAGTGSIAYGRNAQGEAARVGGWGSAISDEGSAHWIGREAVAAAVRSYDAGRRDGLVSTLEQRWNVHCPKEIVQLIHSTAPPDFAGLAALVTKLAEEGEACALAITERAGSDLARLGITAAERLRFDAEAAHFAVAGGVFRGSSAVRQSFRKSLLEIFPRAAIRLDVVRPALGAVSFAAEARE